MLIYQDLTLDICATAFAGPTQVTAINIIQAVEQHRCVYAHKVHTHAGGLAVCLELFPGKQLIPFASITENLRTLLSTE